MEPIRYTDSSRDLARRWVKAARMAGREPQESLRREELYDECRALTVELNSRFGVDQAVKAKVEALSAKYDMKTHTFLE